MNIGLFTDTYFPQVSGVATSIKTLRDELTAQGHAVYIFTTTDPKVAKQSDEPGIYRFPSISYVGFKDRRLAYRGWVQAVQIAKELDLDIIHTQTEFSLGLLGKIVARRLHIPVVHTYHTMYQDYLHYVANGKLLTPGSVRVLIRQYLKNVQAVVAPSAKVEEVLAGYEVPAPILVIPTGVPVPERKVDGSAVRAALGFAEGQPMVLSLGRLAFEKNVETTLTAFVDVLDARPDARLIIVGDGPARSSLEDHADALGIMDAVTFTGMVNHDDVPAYFAAADVFVSSSDSETQGITFVEAMAANRPFVALPSPFLVDLVTDEAIGVLALDYDEFVEGILGYFDRENSDEDARIRRAALTNVDAVTFGQKIIALYTEVLANYQATANDEDEDLNEDEAGYANRLLRNPFRRK